jgi:hypothetical protein
MAARGSGDLPVHNVDPEGDVMTATMRQQHSRGDERLLLTCLLLERLWAPQIPGGEVLPPTISSGAAERASRRARQFCEGKMPWSAMM